MSRVLDIDLWRNGILIDQNQAQKGVLPDHIDGLRNALLDYGRDVPEDLEFKSTEDESRSLNDIAKAINFYGPERISFNLRLTQLKDIKWKAEKLDKDGDCNWEPFFLKHFFDTLLYQTGKADEESDSISYYTEYLKYLFKREGFRQDDRKGLPLPKPDWVSSYTVYHIPKDSIQENLSYGELQYLAQHGLESDASCGLTLGKRATYPDRDWVCFPWLIVQHGKPGGTETQCHHEAANASTAAVMMLERLCKFVPSAIQGKENEHVPPVVAITTVKKMVRVWITYSCRPSVDDAAKFRMMCIWKGDMTAILDLIKFSAILRNAHNWALREQRPRISGFIDLWKVEYPMEFYTEILKDEWQERLRLMARVDEMRQRLGDLNERRGSSNPSSPPSQPVQHTGSQRSSLDGKSTATEPTPTPPQPQFSTALNSSSKPNCQILPLRRRPLATAKQNTKSPQVSSVRPEIFEKGIRVPWASHPGRNISVRLPKPPPMRSETTTDRNPTYKLPMSALTQTTAPDIKFPVVGGQPPAPTKPDTPSKPATPVKPSGTAPAQDKKEEAVRQTPPMTKMFSNIQSAPGVAGLFQTGPSTTSIFSTGGLKPAASQDLPKFNFAGPLPKVKHPASTFDFAPLPTAKDKTLGFTSVLFPNAPPTEKDKGPASSSTFFPSPSMAKDNVHGFTPSARFSSPSATKKDNKTAGSSSAPFSTSPKSKGTFRTEFSKSTTPRSSR